MKIPIITNLVHRIRGTAASAARAAQPFEGFGPRFASKYPKSDALVDKTLDAVRSVKEAAKERGLTKQLPEIMEPHVERMTEGMQEAVAAHEGRGHHAVADRLETTGIVAIAES